MENLKRFKRLFSKLLLDCSNIFSVTCFLLWIILQTIHYLTNLSLHIWEEGNSRLQECFQIMAHHFISLMLLVACLHVVVSIPMMIMLLLCIISIDLVVDHTYLKEDLGVLRYLALISEFHCPSCLCEFIWYCFFAANLSSYSWPVYIFFFYRAKWKCTRNWSWIVTIP